MNTFSLEGPGGIPGLKLARGQTVQTSSNYNFTGTVTFAGSTNLPAVDEITISNSGAAISGANAGLDSAFSNTLRVYNNFSSGNTQIVTPNGSSQFYAGGNNVMNVASTGVTVAASLATTAGGALGLAMSSNAGLGIYFGSGAPTISAYTGSLYVNVAATTTTTRLYINDSGANTSGTTWTTFTSAA